MVSLFRWLAIAGCLVSGVVSAQQPLPPDQQAEQLLVAARKIYNDGNLALAQQQFQAIVQKFSNTPQANAARFGVALCLLNQPEPDYAKAIEFLTNPANDGGFAERAMATHQLASSHRMIALRELAKPNPNQGEINSRWNEARRWFQVSGDISSQKKDDDGFVRSRCDLAEIELRQNRFNEARGWLDPILKDNNYAKCKSRPLALYYHGFTSFLLKDYPTAGRSLNQLAPFNQPNFGLHAEYLVGRILHLVDEKAEASVHYDAVMANFAKLRTEATQALQRPEQFNTNPLEKARLQALASGPIPDYVSGATFHAACLNYESGKFAEALSKFQQFLKDNPNAPLAPDASLRAAFCQVQQKQFDEAAKTLQQLAEKHTRLADQALFWLGKAQIGMAQMSDPTNTVERTNKLKTAVSTLRTAADKAHQLSQQDPDAKLRRQEILFEVADALQLIKQHREAAQIYEQLWNEQALPNRREEILQRLATSLGAGGDIDRSRQRCEEFRRAFPQSTLTPSIIFRQAENSYAKCLELAKASRNEELKERYQEAATGFKEVVEKYPEFERVNLARYALGLCYMQIGHLEDAVKALEGIPPPDRVGELATSSFVQADLLIRLAPTRAEDALQENMIREKLTTASALLDGFVTANPKAPEAALALLKLGYCTKRLGATLADANERNQTLNRAREIFERLVREYKQDPVSGQGQLEMAKVKALLGDLGGAQHDLRQFSQQAELANSRFALLAAIDLAILYRQQNNPTEAAKVLEQARQRYEGQLNSDPDRKELADLLKYHHGLAMMEQNKLYDANTLFGQLVQAGFSTPIGAEAALRAGQCQIRAAQQSLDKAYEARNQAGNNDQKRQQADQQIQQARQSIASAAEQLIRRGDQAKNVPNTNEARARMYYDAAWAWRYLGAEEVRQAREELRKQLRQKAFDELVKKLPPNTPAPAVESVPLPEVTRTQIPQTPSEKNAEAAYRKQIEEFADSALSVDARLELSELLANRNEHDEAIKILKDALDREPTDRAVPTVTLERIRLRLGASLYAKKDYNSAASQFEAVCANTKSAHLGQAFYRAGEAYLASGNATKAAEKLAVYRDKGEFHNRDGVSDRALIRLGQALTALKQYDSARQTFETMLQRFGNGHPLAVEARFGIATTLQQQNRFEDAINSYQQVIAAHQGEIAARSMLQIGLCQLAQRRYSEAASTLLSVAYTYDQFPEIGYSAALEAARACVEEKKIDQAEQLLRKLLRDVPKESDWAKAATERLNQLKK